ncbi:L-histidine N(alpha)-methyltransferase [Nonomuraea sp. NPDC050663]|uniref:L-histidine N(alpha)-methyltransferase n=1 Tax=Nonomuraea sp. NPDC050663 TaxID=3364370 RepID=UPI0037AC6032
MAEGLFTRLDSALEKEWGRWSLNLEGADPRDFLNDLVRGLKGNPDGSGKKIESKHRYVGLVPTISWLLTCRDPSYPVLYDSLKWFARLWDTCLPALDDARYHYVSLGVGSGEKDWLILNQLQRNNPDLLYIALDISAHMLRLGTDEIRKRLPGRVLPIELDFEDRSSLRALRKLLNDMVGDDPILFSLLGNTLANIERDKDFLKNLTTVLRPQDRLALEIATTDVLTESTAAAAAAERRGSRLYNEFATASLGTYTDLTVDTNNLEFVGSVEDSHAIRIEASYVNKSGATIPLMLPNREVIPFRAGEGIRLSVARNYWVDGLRTLFGTCGLHEMAVDIEFGDTKEEVRDSANFGLGVVLLRYEPHVDGTTSPLGRVWGAGGGAPRIG